MHKINVSGMSLYTIFAVHFDAAVAPIFLQLKKGDMRAGAEAALSLSAAGCPLEARHFGFAVLQHMVHARWTEFTEGERTQMARVALDRLHEGAPVHR